MATSSIAPRACLDAPALNGSVALREDAPLKRVSRSGGGVALGGCARGPRLIPLGFGALSACITVALLAQVYSGDYELVPHGVLSSSAAACSRAATDALKEGGRAIDAAAVAALCLAALAPHRTSLDASGALLHWEYREVRTQQPTLYEWGGPPRPQDPPEQAERPPRLVAALAYLHAQLGALPWARVLQPAIQLASKGFPVSEGLAMSATRARPVQPAGANSTAPELARYLASLRANTSAELSSVWGGAVWVRRSVAAVRDAGAWRLVVGGAGGERAARCLRTALDPPPTSPDDAQYRVEAALTRELLTGAVTGAGGGVSTGLAAVDPSDTYVALVMGLSEPFGSGPGTPAGWRRDMPAAPLDLAPAFLLDAHVCGSRYVLGAESWAALAQAGAALAASGAPGAVERARVVPAPGGTLLPETPPSPAVNLVLQRADALSSHADSRGGGLASRF